MTQENYAPETGDDVRGINPDAVYMLDEINAFTGRAIIKVVYYYLTVYVPARDAGKLGELGKMLDARRDAKPVAVTE